MPRSLLPLLAVLACLSSPTAALEQFQFKGTASPVASPRFSPVGVAATPSGNFWVTDEGDHRLLLLSPTGYTLLSVGARGGKPGEFQSPRGVALDSQGWVYVADSGNHRIQVFSPEGKFLSAFGNRGSDPGQLKSPESLAVSPDGVVFVAERDGVRVQLFSRDGIFYRSLDIGTPVTALAVDTAGSFYTAHAKTRTVEKWSSAGQRVRSFTGIEPGVKGFVRPRAIAVDTSGAILVADAGTGQLRVLDPRGRSLGAFGRSGSEAGQFKSLEAVAVAGDEIVLADNRLRRLSTLSRVRSEALPPLEPRAALRLQVRLGTSVPLAADRLAWNPDGTLHALSIEQGRITTYDPATGSSSTLDLVQGLKMRKPSGLATAPSSGSLFVSDSAGDRVVKIDKDGKLLLEYPRVFNPQGMACTPQGLLFVVSGGDGKFQAYNHQGMFQLSGGEKGSGLGQLKFPISIAWDTDRLYLADTDNHKVAVYNPAGRFLREIGAWGPEPLLEPRHVAVDREGHVFVLDSERGRIQVYDPQGVYLGGFGSLGRGPGTFERPRHFALNDHGDLVVADQTTVRSFRVTLAPAAPANVSAEPGEGYVSLKWDAVPARFPARYKVIRRAPGGNPEPVKETVETTAVDDTLTPGTTYTWTIIAQSVQGADSVPSLPVSGSAQPVMSGPRLEIVQAQIDNVFSAHYKAYARSSFGRVRIRNNGRPPVVKIKVSFAIQGYMDYPTEIEIPELKSMEEKDVPITATFNNRILEVTETTPIQAQVKLTYYAGDQEASTVSNLPFTLYSRNTIRWDRKERLAAFITPNDPPVVDFARAAAVPLAEERKASPVPAAITTAWSVFSSLGAYGISYLPRPNNPYDRVSLDSSTVDSLQFARETLSRKSGDCADVVALVASLLESLTVTTVALDAPGHLFLMVDTGESQREALGFPEDLLVSYAGTYWIPLEATLIGHPFLEAWKQGAEQARRLSAQRKLSFIDTHVAWREYEPATLPEVASGAKAPEKRVVEEKFHGDWKTLIDLRWQTSAAAWKAATAKNPASGDAWLRLGLLAAEFRRFEEAKGFFTRAKQDPTTSASASNNLGNLAMMNGDYPSAESFYQQAAQRDAKDPRILLNLTRVYLKSSQTRKASAAYEKAMALDPTLRETYPEMSVLMP